MKDNVEIVFDDTSMKFKLTKGQLQNMYYAIEDLEGFDFSDITDTNKRRRLNRIMAHLFDLKYNLKSQWDNMYRPMTTEED